MFEKRNWKHIITHLSIWLCGNLASWKVSGNKPTGLACLLSAQDPTNISSPISLSRTITSSLAQILTSMTPGGKGPDMPRLAKRHAKIHWWTNRFANHNLLRHKGSFGLNCKLETFWWLLKSLSIFSISCHLPLSSWRIMFLAVQNVCWPTVAISTLNLSSDPTTWPTWQDIPSFEKIHLADAQHAAIQDSKCQKTKKDESKQHASVNSTKLTRCPLKKLGSFYQPRFCSAFPRSLFHNPQTSQCYALRGRDFAASFEKSQTLRPGCIASMWGLSSCKCLPQSTRVRSMKCWFGVNRTRSGHHMLPTELMKLQVWDLFPRRTRHAYLKPGLLCKQGIVSPAFIGTTLAFDLFSPLSVPMAARKAAHGGWKRISEFYLLLSHPEEI